MQSLVGKKVWVIQYDDEEDAVLGICLGVDQNFIALRQEHEADPSLFINLTNVKEIEVFRTDGEGELRYLRAVKDEE